MVQIAVAAAGVAGTAEGDVREASGGTVGAAGGVGRAAAGESAGNEREEWRDATDCQMTRRQKGAGTVGRRAIALGEPVCGMT